MSPARHEAELRAGQLGGLAIADARATRVRIEDGDLVLSRADGTRRVLAAAGTVTRISHVPRDEIRHRRFRPPAYDGLVLVWCGDDLATALSVEEWWRPSSNLEGLDLRTAAGFEAVAEALGLVVERATPAEVARARRLRHADLLTARDPAAAPRSAVPLAALAVVLVFVSMVAVASGWWWTTLPPLVLLVPLVTGFLRRRQRFAALVGSRPDPGPRRVVRPAPPLPTTANLAEAELQVGEHDLVLVWEGTEWWVPGPAAGGVAKASIHSDLILLSDRRDRLLLPLDAEVWGAATDDLVRALDGAGIAVTRAPHPSLRPEIPLAALTAQGHWPIRVDHLDDGGVDLKLPVLLYVGAGTHLLPTALGATLVGPGDPVGFAVCLAAAAVCVVLLAMAVRASRLAGAWQRAQRRPVQALSDPVTSTEGILP